MKKLESIMITPEGGLTITVEPKEVTWFHFLQASRTTTWINGGWNSKSYWQEGLNLLGSKDASFLVDWTKNSLAAKDPNPRKKVFMFDRELSKERGRLKDRGVIRKGESLDKLSENEINTRLFHDGAHGLWGQNIGYEISLAAESDGQLKVDIFAIGDDKNSLGKR